MALLAETSSPIWHFGGGVGFHWADLLSAILALVAVAGLALIVAGRTARQRAALEQTIAVNAGGAQPHLAPQARVKLVATDSRPQPSRRSGHPLAADDAIIRVQQEPEDG